VLLVLINIGYSISGWTVIDEEGVAMWLINRGISPSPLCSLPPCSVSTPRRG